MTQDALDFIQWLFDAGWSLLKSIPHPAWKNMTVADFLLSVFAIKVAFTVLNLVFGIGGELEQRDKYYADRVTKAVRSRTVKVSKARANDEK